jgi:hypothetical protein
MLEGCKLANLTPHSDSHIATYKRCLALMICSLSRRGCCFYECSECPWPSNFKNMLENLFEESCIEKVTFKQWIFTDGCSLQLLDKTPGIFVN